MCWLCDFWWLILLLIFLIIAAILTRDYWLPLLRGSTVVPTLPVSVTLPPDELPTLPVSVTLPPDELPTLTLPTLEPPIQETPPQITATASTLVGQPAPLFSLDGLNGDRVALADFAGKPVLVIFFASWCPNCQNEAPLIQSLADQNSARGLQVIAINITNNDSEQDASNFAQAHGWTFPVGLDRDRSVGESYGVEGVPFHVVVDAQGIVRGQRLGELSAAELQQLVDLVLVQ